MDAAARVIAGACCTGNLDDIGPTMKTAKETTKNGNDDNDDMWNDLDQLDMDFNVVEDDNDKDNKDEEEEEITRPSSDKTSSPAPPPASSRKMLFSGLRHNHHGSNNSNNKSASSAVSSASSSSSSPYETMTEAVATRVEQRKEVYSKYYMPDRQEVEGMEQLAKGLSLHGEGSSPSSLLSLMSIWGGGSSNKTRGASDLYLQDSDETDPLVLARVREEFASPPPPAAPPTGATSLLDSPRRRRRLGEQQRTPNILLTRGGPVTFVTTLAGETTTSNVVSDEGTTTTRTSTRTTNVYEQEGEVVVLTNAVLLVSHTKPYLRGRRETVTTTIETRAATPPPETETPQQTEQEPSLDTSKEDEALGSPTEEEEDSLAKTDDDFATGQGTKEGEDKVDNKDDDKKKKKKKKKKEEEEEKSEEEEDEEEEEAEEDKQPEQAPRPNNSNSNSNSNSNNNATGSRRFTPKQFFRKMTAKVPSSSKIVVKPLPEEGEEAEGQEEDPQQQDKDSVVCQWIPTHNNDAEAAAAAATVVTKNGRRGTTTTNQTSKLQRRQRVKILACLEWRAIAALQDLALFAPVDFLHGERSLLLQQQQQQDEETVWRMECPTRQEQEAWLQVFSAAILQTQLHWQQEEHRRHAAAVAAAAADNKEEEEENEKGQANGKEEEEQSEAQKDLDHNEGPPPPPPPKSLGWQHEILQTSLFSAAVCNNVTMIQQWKERQEATSGCSVNDQDEENGKTALHYATLYQHAAAMDALLKLPNVNPNAPDEDGHAPLYYVDADKQPDLVQLLLQHGANKSELTKDSKSELFGAASSFLTATTTRRHRTPKKAGKTAAAAAAATKAQATMSETMSALQERGQHIEKLHNRGANLQEDAANFREMAKLMKEKAKKQNSGGLFGAFRG